MIEIYSLVSSASISCVLTFDAVTWWHVKKMSNQMCHKIVTNVSSASISCVLICLLKKYHIIHYNYRLVILIVICYIIIDTRNLSSGIFSLIEIDHEILLEKELSIDILLFVSI